jgi:hypothetical protein
MRDFAGYVARDYVELENLSFWGGSQAALVLSGDGVKANRVHAYNGLLRVNNTAGMTNLVLSNFKAMRGLDVRGSGATTAGLTIRDGEARGNRSNTVAVQQVSGTSSAPVRIQNVFSHNGWSHRYTTFGYNCYMGDWNADSVGNRRRAAHGIYVGDSTSTPFMEYVYIDGNTAARTFDGIGLYNCNNCRIWNNTLGDDNGQTTSKTQNIMFAGVSNLDIRNNLIFRESGDLGNYGFAHLNLSTASSDTFTSNYNLFHHPTISGAIAAWRERDGSVYTLTESKSRSLEGANSTETSNGSHYFVNPDPAANDYRLLSGSPAIDHGDPSRCPWNRIGSACEIGAKEFGTTTADTTPPGSITTLAASGASGSPAVQLTWTEVSDDGGSTGSGNVSTYQARYSISPITSNNWSTASVIDTAAWAPLAPGAQHQETVNGLAASTTYYFAVRSVDDVGLVGPLSNVPTVTTGTAGAPPPPEGLQRTDTR